MSGLWDKVLVAVMSVALFLAGFLGLVAILLLYVFAMILPAIPFMAVAGFVYWLWWAK